jgi:hypothetical protein
MFLPWQTTVSESGTESVQGTGVNGGQWVLVLSLVTIGLIQVGWRPAWIGAGLAGAITVREILSLAGGDDVDPASGLWIAAAASLVAVVLLIWEMFAGISAPGDGTGGDDGKPGPGLSGPLGKRKR